MKHQDFQIGMDFYTHAGRWRCTDIGTRTVTAVRLWTEHTEDQWAKGPPYAIKEYTFDESDFDGCFSDGVE